MKVQFLIFLICSLSLFAQSNNSYLLKHGDITLPINNNGVIADVIVDSLYLGMTYNGNVILYSGGFMLSGYNNDSLWANGVASASRIQDYSPGSYLHSEHDDLANLYILKSGDIDFGDSWQNWKDAVKLGADYYDGNNDGIYNPLDLNGNNKWDYGEDRPDLLGEETIWCIYKDDVPNALRRFTVSPKGIEIQQTVFSTLIPNIIFIRYRIINSGLVSETLDSVYFSIFSDPDIGGYLDDLVGCDSTINAGFGYQNTPDRVFGNSAPTFLTSFVQGPYSYIPGKTFKDNNANGVFDEGDESLSTANAINGVVKGISIKEGAITLPITSLSPTHFGDIGSDSDTHFEIRNTQLGLWKSGELINPCDWKYGEVFNEDCNNINGLFPYSGNPIIPQGWINNQPMDQRFMINTGPFQLAKGEPIDIVVAYVVGYNENSSLSSLQNAKVRTTDMLPYFENNQFEIILADTIDITEKPVELFGLKQNYPNPFNSTTNIKYAIPHRKMAENVSIKIYNLLGEVVATLVDEVQSSGIYSINFSSENLTSGLYIISLTNLEYSDSKKLMVLK